MSVKPILFNTEMVWAILDGRKTVTRRVIKPQPIHEDGFWKLGDAGWSDNIKKLTPVPCHSLYNRMLYRPGDILYVRETWCRFDCSCCEGDIFTGKCQKEHDTQEGCYMYRATDEITGDNHWRPSIHMPKEAARIWLKVTDVRVERLRDMTEEQAVKEGLESGSCEYKGAVWGQDDCDEWTAKEAFAELWDSTIKKRDLSLYGWEANPWVWVIEFERTVKPDE